MDTERPDWIAPTPAAKPPGPSQRGLNLERIAVGAATIFVVMVFLYGLNNAFMIVALLTICTAGFGLIPAVFASWLAGVVVLAIADAMRKAIDRDGSAASRDASGS